MRKISIRELLVWTALVAVVLAWRIDAENHYGERPLVQPDTCPKCSYALWADHH